MRIKSAKTYKETEIVPKTFNIIIHVLCMLKLLLSLFVFILPYKLIIAVLHMRKLKFSNCRFCVLSDTPCCFNNSNHYYYYEYS